MVLHSFVNFICSKLRESCTIERATCVRISTPLVNLPAPVAEQHPRFFLSPHPFPCECRVYRQVIFFPIRAVSFSLCPLRAPFLAHVLSLGACQRPHNIFSPHATRGCFPLAAWLPSFGDRATFSRRHFLACLPFFCTVFVPTCPQALIRTGTRLHLK